MLVAKRQRDQSVVNGYLVSLRHMAFNDRQDVMQGQTCHFSTAKAHHITQHQSGSTLSLLTTDVDRLQLTQMRRQLSGMDTKAVTSIHHSTDSFFHICLNTA